MLLSKCPAVSKAPSARLVGPQRAAAPARPVMRRRCMPDFSDPEMVQDDWGQAKSPQDIGGAPEATMPEPGAKQQKQSSGGAPAQGRASGGAPALDALPDIGGAPENTMPEPKAQPQNSGRSGVEEQVDLAKEQQGGDNKMDNVMGETGRQGPDSLLSKRAGAGQDNDAMDQTGGAGELDAASQGSSPSEVRSYMGGEEGARGRSREDEASLDGVAGGEGVGREERGLLMEGGPGGDEVLPNNPS